MDFISSSSLIDSCEGTMWHIVCLKRGRREITHLAFTKCLGTWTAERDRVSILLICV